MDLALDAMESASVSTLQHSKPASSDRFPWFICGATIHEIYLQVTASISPCNTRLAPSLNELHCSFILIQGTVLEWKSKGVDAIRLPLDSSPFALSRLQYQKNSICHRRALRSPGRRINLVGK